MDFTDDERDEYQRELEDLDETDLLLEIMVDLKAIRYELQDPAPEPQSDSDRYQCLQCRDVVPEDQRQKHLINQHGAPAELSPEGEFSKV